jgi:hypothetical protein
VCLFVNRQNDFISLSYAINRLVVQNVFMSLRYAINCNMHHRTQTISHVYALTHFTIFRYVDSIQADLKTLGIHHDGPITFTSDYFAQLRDLAEKFITEGKAYCDDTPLGRWFDCSAPAAFICVLFCVAS